MAAASSSTVFDFSIRTPQQLYAVWHDESRILKGYRRKCDLKWLSLATWVRANEYDAFDLKYQDVVLGPFREKFPGLYRHDANLPILRMPLKQTIDTLQGLEWYIFCEMYDADPRRGTAEWLKEVRHMVNLVRHRLYFLAVEPLSNKILNDGEFTLTDEELLQSQRRTSAEGATEMKGGGILLERDYHTDDEDDAEAVKKYDQKKRLDMELAQRKQQIMDSLQKASSDFEKVQAKMAMGGSTEKETRINQTFAFDVNTILHSIDIGLDMYQAQYMSIPRAESSQERHDAATMFRKIVLDRFKSMSTIFIVRRRWHCSVVIIDSFRDIFKRKKRLPLDSEVSDEDVVMFKLGEDLYLPKTHAEFLLQPIGLDKKQWARVNTDALFEIHSAQLGDISIYHYLHKTQEEAEFIEDAVCIFRVRVSGMWCLQQPPKRQRRLFDSFTHAFVALRMEMKRKKLPDTIRVVCKKEDYMKKRLFIEYDLSLMDELFFPSQTGAAENGLHGR